MYTHIGHFGQCVRFFLFLVTASIRSSPAPCPFANRNRLINLGKAQKKGLPGILGLLKGLKLKVRLFRVQGLRRGGRGRVHVVFRLDDALSHLEMLCCFGNTLLEIRVELRFLYSAFITGLKPFQFMTPIYPTLRLLILELHARCLSRASRWGGGGDGVDERRGGGVALCLIGGRCSRMFLLPLLSDRAGWDSFGDHCAHDGKHFVLLCPF